MAIDLEYYKEQNNQFYETVGIISWYEDLEAAGLSPNNVICNFGKPHIEMLLNFCLKNPKFHIVTTLSDYKTVNRFIRGDYIYSLASGSNDPSLELISPPELVDHMMRENLLFLKTMKSFRSF